MSLGGNRFPSAPFASIDSGERGRECRVVDFVEYSFLSLRHECIVFIDRHACRGSLPWLGQATLLPRFAAIIGVTAFRNVPVLRSKLTAIFLALFATQPLSPSGDGGVA